MDPLVVVNWVYVGNFQEHVIGLELDDEHLLDGSVPAMAAADGGRLLQRKVHRLAAVVFSIDSFDVCDLKWHTNLLLIDEGLI